MDQMEQVTNTNKELKKIKKNYLLYAVLFVIILILAAIAISFAFFDGNNTASGTTNAQLTLDCINISYSEEDVINLDNQYPVSDDYAISNIQPVTVTVENHCSNNIDAINYSVTLSSLANATGFIPDTKIRTYVTRNINASSEEIIQNASYLSDIDAITDSNMLTTLNNDLNTRENIKDYTTKKSYILHSGSISDGSIHTFKIYLWVDYYEGDKNMHDLINNPNYEHDRTFDNTTEELDFAAAISLYVNPTADVNTTFTAFQKVEYIESTGTQYIDTGFNPNPTTTKVETVFQLTNSKSSTQALFGSRPVATSVDRRSTHIFYNVNGGKFRIDWIGNINETITPNTNEDILMSCYNNVVVVNGDEYTSSVTKDTNYSIYPIYIGNLNNAGGPFATGAHARFKTFKIYDNGFLERDFIPVYRKSDGVVGLFDKVYQKFYTNSGSGSLTAGPDIID